MTPQRLSWPLSIFVVSGAMMWWTWGTWLDPFIDFGRELYLPWQIVQGKKLYVDLASFSGPLSPHVNAIWFWLFGIGLRSIVVGNSVILGLLIVLIHRLIRAIADSQTGWFCCLIFVLIFAFGEYDDVGNFNYITPYSHEIVHGLVASIASLLAFTAVIANPGGWASLVCGVFLGLVFLTKPEVFAAVVFAEAVGWMFFLTSGKRAFRIISLWWLGWFVVVGGALSALSTQISFAAALSGITAPYRHLFGSTLRNQKFYVDMMGLDNAAQSLALMLESATVWLTVCWVFLALAKWTKVTWRLEISVAAMFIGFVGAVAFNREIVSGVARALPLLLVFLVVYLLWKTCICDRATPIDIARVVVVLFAAALLVKMAGNAHVRGYGFVLTMPASLIAIVTLVAWIPRALSNRQLDGPLFGRLSMATAVIVSGVFILAHSERVHASRSL
jgi:hypothetical protein